MWMNIWVASFSNLTWTSVSDCQMMKKCCWPARILALAIKIFKVYLGYWVIILQRAWQCFKIVNQVEIVATNKSNDWLLICFRIWLPTTKQCCDHGCRWWHNIFVRSRKPWFCQAKYLCQNQKWVVLENIFLGWVRRRQAAPSNC